MIGDSMYIKEETDEQFGTKRRRVSITNDKNEICIKEEEEVEIKEENNLFEDEENSPRTILGLKNENDVDYTNIDLPGKTSTGLISPGKEEAADKKLSGKHLKSQTKHVILNIYNYFRSQDKEASETDINKKTAIASGISLQTLNRIRQDDKGVVKSPPPKIGVSPWLPVVDDYARSLIRREILSFYERSKFPSLEAMSIRVKEPPLNLTCSWATLNKLVKQIGFRKRKLENGRPVLMEKDDIIAARNRYLRLIGEIRKSSNLKPEIYIGEVCVYPNRYVAKCCTVDDTTLDPTQKLKRRVRFTIVYAGGKDGFIPGSFLIFKSGTALKETHESMTHECFQSWFQTQLLPNIPANSVIVMDNAPYHSQFSIKMPALNSNKSEILQWLGEHNIAHETSRTKYELIDLVRKTKSKLVHVIDQMAHDAGHEVLRIPMFHCHLNPIELIWARLRSKLEENSNTYKRKCRPEEIKYALERITKEDWKRCLYHAKQVEDEYRRKDGVFDYVMERVNTSVHDESSDSDSSGE
ncbi:uncharacterized protein LOC134762951 [Penaeus indicus]|uniref:uncharacterized protein LOC134762951 n=1 Tax=Penaeus indicus TaxID=29960 RepID=UPI00300DA079